MHLLNHSLFGKRNPSITLTRNRRRELRQRHFRHGPAILKRAWARFELLESRLPLSAGGIDPNFGLAGSTYIPIAPHGGSTANSLAVQPDGSIVEVGWYSSGPASRDVAIGRLLADGSVDASFGHDGKVYWQPSGNDDSGGADNEALAVAIKPDGKILVEVMLEPYSNVGFAGKALLQLNADGSIDKGFGTDGVVESSQTLYGGTLLVAPNGQFYMGRYDASLTRFNANGTVDSSFQAATLSLPNLAWNSIAFDAQGRLVATGYMSPGNGTAMVVARFLTNGNLDTSFDDTGYFSSDFAGAGPSMGDNAGSSLIVQTDGKIVVGGVVQVFHGTLEAVPALVRFNSDGTLDTTFGTGGIAEEPGAWRIAYVALGPDGKFIAFADRFYGTDPEYIERINANGTLDTFFGGVAPDAPGTISYNVNNSVTADSNGNILNFGGDFFLIRRLYTQPPRDAVNLNSARYEVAPGQQQTTIEVDRPTPGTGTLMVNYATTDGTATAANGDYTATAGTLTFGPGVASQTFTVDTNGSVTGAADKSFQIKLSSASGGTLGMPTTATVTLLSPGVFQLSKVSDNYTPGQTLPITVKRTNGSDGNTTVDYSVSAGTAIDGYDFTSVSGTLTFPPDQTSVTFDLAIPTNQADHPIDGLTVDLMLSNPTGGAAVGNNGQERLTFGQPLVPPVEAIGGQTLSATVGANLSGATLATFTDPNGNLAPGQYQATIDWGDGTPATTGAVTGPDANSVFTVTGSHTYLLAIITSNTVSVVVTRGDSESATATDVVNVADAPLALSGKTLAVQTGKALSGPIATFTDSGGAQALSAYSAIVDWGDGGGALPATISGPDGNGVFTVTGRHTYVTAGTPSATITVHHDGVLPDVSVVDSVTVTPPPVAVSASGTGTLVATVFTAVTETLATFSDPNGTGALVNYSATVNWDDGTGTVPATVSGPDASGYFTVTANHMYTNQTSSQPHTVGVVITRVGSPDTTVTDAANVVDKPLSVSGRSLVGQTGTALSGNIATFTDPGGDQFFTFYSATVDWGDGSGALAAAISRPANSIDFTISGSHTYTVAGTFAATVIVHHNGVSPDVVIHDSVAVSGPVIYSSAGGDVTVKVSGGNLQIVAGTSVVSSTLLADVTSVRIDGADGVPNDFKLDYSQGAFLVPGGITFNGGALPATPSNSLMIAGGNFDTDTFTFSTAHNGSIQLGKNGQLVNYTNMTPLLNTGTAANAVFKLPDGTVVATLDAGTTVGTVQLLSGNGSFETTTFAAPSGSLTVNSGAGSDTVTTTSNFYDVFTANLTVSGVANTLPLHGLAISNLSTTEGETLSTKVATFSDPNGAGSISDYSATIDWGDTTSASAGTVSGPDASGLFTVTGIHTYPEENATANTISVTIHRANATDVTVADLVSVADAGLNAANASITATQGTTFSGTVASFTDDDPNGLASDFSATISWGDGAMSAGTVAVNTAGPGFVVVGNHLYGSTGTKTVTVTIHDVGGATATAGSAATVVALLPPTSRPDTLVLGPAGPYNGSGQTSVLANDSSADGRSQSLVATVMSQPSNGSLTLNADGSFTYTPGAGFQGIDRFTYQISEGGMTGNTVNVTLLSYHASLVDKLYRQVLHRSAEDSGLIYWASRLDAGQPLEVVATGIFNSTERLNPLVTQFYEQFLGRNTDPIGLAYWVNDWQTKGDPRDVVANILASQEFFDDAGDTNTGYITLLYQRVLQRPVEQSGLNYWVGLTSAPANDTRLQIASQFYDTHEKHVDLVNFLFGEYFLGVSPQPDPTPYVHDLDVGQTETQVEEAIIDSSDYRSNPTEPAAGAVGRALYPH